MALGLPELSRLTEHNPELSELSELAEFILSNINLFMS